MRIRAGGQVVEDIGMHNRVLVLFTIFRVTVSRDNDYGEGFSNCWDNVVDVDTVDARHVRGIHLVIYDSII